jgi:hypothetical protein
MVAGDLVCLAGVTYYKADVMVACVTFVGKFFSCSARTPVSSNGIVAKAVRRTWIAVAFVNICREN